MELQPGTKIFTGSQSVSTAEDKRKVIVKLMFCTNCDMDEKTCERLNCKKTKNCSTNFALCQEHNHEDVWSAMWLRDRKYLIRINDKKAWDAKAAGEVKECYTRLISEFDLPMSSLDQVSLPEIKKKPEQ